MCVVHNRGQSVCAASCAQYRAVGLCCKLCTIGGSRLCCKLCTVGAAGLCCKLCTIGGSRFVLQIVHSTGQSVCAASCAQYRAVGLCCKFCTIGGSRFVLQIVHRTGQSVCAANCAQYRAVGLCCKLCTLTNSCLLKQTTLPVISPATLPLPIEICTAFCQCPLRVWHLRTALSSPLNSLLTSYTLILN